MENCIITKQSYNPKTTRSSHKVLTWKRIGEINTDFFFFFFFFFGDKQRYSKV
jgi:hypothetical protein